VEKERAKGRKIWEAFRMKKGRCLRLEKRH
jgi:hypothetical protein